jgi:hypothetical protein
MIRLLTVVFMLVAIVSTAQVPSPSTPMILLPDGTSWSGASSSTIGTATIDPNTPPTKNSMTAVSVTASAANVASLANRKSVSVFNTSTTDTCWVSLDATTASATVGTSIPIPPMGYLTTELASAKTVSLVASAALTAVVYQDGY